MCKQYGPELWFKILNITAPGWVLTGLHEWYLQAARWGTKAVVILSLETAQVHLLVGKTEFCLSQPPNAESLPYLQQPSSQSSDSDSSLNHLHCHNFQPKGVWQGVGGWAVDRSYLTCLCSTELSLRSGHTVRKKDLLTEAPRKGR